jgi:hypothetical protein
MKHPGEARRSRVRIAAPGKKSRGSVLIVALLLAGIIGISLSSYLKLAITSLRTASRSFYANSSVNYAEIGIEQAMACFYTVSAGTAAETAWSGWTLNTTTKEATRTFPGATAYFTAGPGSTAQVKVYVQKYDYSGTPLIVAKAVLTPSEGPALEKYVKITLRSRSLFSNGLVARNLIDWAGSPSADSWNSDPDNNPATAAVPYSTAIRLANCIIGCISATNGAIDLANGTLMGSVATGGGTVAGSPTITGNTTYDFSASFPSISTPAPTTANSVTTTINTTTTFPRGTDAMNASDTTYYYNFGTGAGIDVNGGGKNIQIDASKKVVFIFNNHTGATAFSIGGNAFMNVNTGATLKIYSNGNLELGGNGVANSNDSPSSFLIYGTRATTGQTITINGNGQLRAAVYAPNAAVTANGGGSGGDIQGSIVANAIDMNGGPNFHYDQALGNLNAGAGVGVSQWKELQTAAERSAYSGNFNF